MLKHLPPFCLPHRRRFRRMPNTYNMLRNRLSCRLRDSPRQGQGRGLPLLPQALKGLPPFCLPHRRRSLRRQSIHNKLRSRPSCKLRELPKQGQGRGLSLLLQALKGLPPFCLPHRRRSLRRQSIHNMLRNRRLCRLRELLRRRRLCGP